MPPKEKAHYLISEMKKNLYSDGISDAKRCALVAISEILETNKGFEFSCIYWNMVKEEVEKF